MSICRFPHGAPPPRRRPCATRSSGKPRSPSGSRRSARPGSDDYRIGYIKTLADARKDGEALSEARRLVAEQASVAHLQTLSYVYLRLGKSWDQLLVDTQILDREPQNKTALASLMATLTRNRIDSPALGTANSVELTPAEKRNLQLNAAAELVRLADTLPAKKRRVTRWPARRSRSMTR